jgi:hypothetical protein
LQVVTLIYLQILEYIMEHATNISTYLEKAAKHKSRGLYLSSGQWISRGATDFKRKIMGICGTRAIKSADELADILIAVNPNSCELKEELKTIASKLDNQKIKYDWGTIYFQRIEEKNNPDSCIKYLITKC